MIIAVPTENEGGLDSYVAHHFGRAPYFTLIEVEDGEVKDVRVLEAPATHEPGELPALLRRNNVEIILAYGMGDRAAAFFESYGIKVLTGVEGKVREVVKAFIEDRLKTDERWRERREFRERQHSWE